jgi:nitrate/nitrite transport system ATP-binding protein
MPWLTARENVALGVDKVYPHATPAERREIVEYYLARVGLADSMHKKASELSNGMKQRVGIARAFALSPRLLLLDEPFGALDALTRASLQDELVRIVESIRATVVMVTHDIDEAILLGDRILMMTNGPAARIGGVVDVKLARPRDRLTLATSRDFAEHREQLLQFLYRHKTRVAGASSTTP